MMVMMTRLAATKLPTPQTPPPPPPLIIGAQRLWNLTITLSYYSFLAKAEKHWSKNHKLLSRLSDCIMVAKDKQLILQLNLVGSSCSQTFLNYCFHEKGILLNLSFKSVS